MIIPCKILQWSVLKRLKTLQKSNLSKLAYYLSPSLFSPMPKQNSQVNCTVTAHMENSILLHRKIKASSKLSTMQLVFNSWAKVVKFQVWEILRREKIRSNSDISNRGRNAKNLGANAKQSGQSAKHKVCALVRNWSTSWHCRTS